MERGYASQYRKFVNSVFARKEDERPLTTEQAMAEAVGGRFDELGRLMFKILLESGLMPEHYLIDVGCGSGRLTKFVSSYLTGRYLGTDVVAALLDHAGTYGRPGWRFETVSEIAIPESDGRADMVCFFSVLTHLLHEDAYRYLREAKRVLKLRGRIVFSFLEFRVYESRAVFRKMVADKDAGIEEVTNQFISRDAIETWADELGLKVTRIVGGDVNQVSENGGGICSLGQSICVLEKNENFRPATERERDLPVV
jgi:ubiquinone/menaquinone biosynthesis C-methylase UbiE